MNSQASPAGHRGYSLQPSSVLELSSLDRDSLIVSAINVNGSWQTVSRYGDDSWLLHSGVTNQNKGYRTLNFTTVPEPFRAAMKAIMYRFMRRGSMNRGRLPSVSTVRLLFWDSISFFRYILSLGIERLQDVSPFVCATYVQEMKGRTSARGKSFSRTTLEKRFRAIEMLHELSKHTDDSMPTHPWPDSSAKILSGTLTGSRGSRHHGVTPLIPDHIFCALFQASHALVQKAQYILDLRDELATVESAGGGNSKEANTCAMRRHLVSRGWAHGLAKFQETVTDLRTACYIIVASLSGCRNHEIAAIQCGSYYRTEGSDGETYWWMRSQSIKTDAGDTEWMIPEAAVRALQVMDRWAIPYQTIIADEIAQRRAIDPTDTEIAEAERHLKAVFLGRGSRNGNAVRTISLRSLSVSLLAFAKKNGIAWNVATHQFRRTFAHYAARSQYGDLRYLKEHFKHWTIDMTLLYALNDALEETSFEEIGEEVDSLREAKIDLWLSPDVPLSGRTGRGFVEYRGANPITLFKSRAEMIQTISENIEIRSNGHAWCSAHHGIDCVGNGGLDRIRCTDCQHSVIEAQHAPFYQGLYEHLETLLDCDDIGEGGLLRVRRDLDRCAIVLRDLGHELNNNGAA